ncbi:hypothetical protein [Curtobacterium sp. MCBA15_007]|uniref:hypothetical protein n=1 Tax=Curtobacterium sp. MCBA15_007 TaxID=1898735 RepID=UPI0015875169|nr:hypothetical protein [Curtobacterium sp. MCBA15_007]
MFEWGSFVTGLVGALMGGAASLLVQNLSARRDRRARQRKVALQVGESFRAAVEPLLLHEEIEQRDADCLRALQAIYAATVGLRLEITKRELPIAEWIASAHKELAGLVQVWGKHSYSEKNVKGLTGTVNSVNKHLAE